MLIDSHCHLPDEKYEKDIEGILSEAKEAGVGRFISIGTSLQDSKKALKTAKEHEDIFCTVAVYPHEDLGIELPKISDGLRALIAEGGEQIVGIGECGLDISPEYSGKNARDLVEQKELFKLQIGLAVEYDLPVAVHNRNSDEDTYQILSKYKDTNLRGVMHCFVSDWEFAKKMLDLNFYISFSGIVTFPSAGEDLLKVVKNIPSDRYLVETDAPLLAPQGHRGQVNYPKYVKIVAEKIAEIRNTTFEQVEKETCKNTCDLFKI